MSALPPYASTGQRVWYYLFRYGICGAIFVFLITPILVIIPLSFNAQDFFTFTEKMLLGRLMATHGVDYFRNHVLHFSDTDEELIEELKPYLQELDMGAVRLAYPEVRADDQARAAITSLSGSNNWAVRGALSASGKPMLATDPHQPHSIPNTFFYVHLHAPDWDAFGAAFPGVPYFMMGYTRDVAWGLTTGFVDS